MKVSSTLSKERYMRVSPWLPAVSDTRAWLVFISSMSLYEVEAASVGASFTSCTIHSCHATFQSPHSTVWSSLRRYWSADTSSLLSSSVACSFLRSQIGSSVVCCMTCAGSINTFAVNVRACVNTKFYHHPRPAHRHDSNNYQEL